jgi:DNA-directed RNA polymerase specialized sigma24 family protein
VKIRHPEEFWRFPGTVSFIVCGSGVFSMQLEHSHREFPPTAWSSVAQLQDDIPDEVRRQSLERFINRYWPPVYAHLRRRKHPPEAAAELTQSFFSDVVLGRNLPLKADAQKGKLRTLILTALNNYLIDKNRRTTARPDGFALDEDAIQREEQRFSQVNTSGPGDEFDRRWAYSVLEETILRCEQHFRNGHKPGHWAVFEARVLQPAMSGREPPALAQLHDVHGFRSPAHAATALYQVRQRFQTLLREVISETVANTEDVESEVQTILDTLSRATT